MDIVEILMFTHKQRARERGGMVTSPVVNTYTVSSHTFGTKEPKMEKDTSVADRLARMKVKYATSYNANPLFDSRENEGK
jgi:hypothetical protein